MHCVDGRTCCPTYLPLILLEGNQSRIDKKVMRESLKRIIIVSILDLHEFC